MSEVKIVQIRKKGGLDKIIKDVNSGTTLDPILYNTTSKDKNEEGVMEGKYRGKTILDTKHFIAPMWLEQKNQWAFDGNTQDLSRLIDKMKLRYPKNHPRERAIIRSSSEDAERLTNRHDDVFCHPDLYGKYFMENGRISLNLADAKQEFLYLCYRGDTAVEDKSSDEKVSKYIRAGAKYELVSPKKETIKAKKHADKEVKAIKLLAAMDNDEERLRAIATIMELPQYSHTTDISGVFLLLKDMAAQNDSFSAKYNKNYQDRFIELAEMENSDLEINSQIVSGVKYGLLRRRQGYYLFNGERIDGIDNNLQLFNYFKNPKNQEDYLKLLDLLKDGR